MAHSREAPCVGQRIKAPFRTTCGIQDFEGLVLRVTSTKFSVLWDGYKKPSWVLSSRKWSACQPLASTNRQAAKPPKSQQVVQKQVVQKQVVQKQVVQKQVVQKQVVQKQVTRKRALSHGGSQAQQTPATTPTKAPSPAASPASATTPAPSASTKSAEQTPVTSATSSATEAASERPAPAPASDSSLNSKRLRVANHMRHTTADEVVLGLCAEFACSDKFEDHSQLGRALFVVGVNVQTSSGPTTKKLLMYVKACFHLDCSWCSWCSCAASLACLCVTCKG